MGNDGSPVVSPDDDPQSELNVLRREVRQLQADVRNSGLQIAAGQEEIIRLRNALGTAEADIEVGLAREADLRMQLETQTLKKEHVETTLSAAEVLVASLRDMMEGEAGLTETVPGERFFTTEQHIFDPRESKFSSRETVEGFELEQVLNSITEPAPSRDSVASQVPAPPRESIDTDKSIAIVRGSASGPSIRPAEAVVNESISIPDSRIAETVTVTSKHSDSTSQGKVAAAATKAQKAVLAPQATTIPLSNSTGRTISAQHSASSPHIGSSNLLFSAFGQGATAAVHQTPAIHPAGVRAGEPLPSEVEKIIQFGPAPHQTPLPAKVSLALNDAHSGEIFALAASFDCKWFASAGDDKTVRIYDANCVPYSQIGETSRAITSLVFHPGVNESNPDAVIICSGSSDGTLRTFRRNPRRKSKWVTSSVLPVHTQAIRRLLFTSVDGTSDSSLLLSCSTDRTIKLTDLEHGKRPFATTCTSAVLDVTCFDDNVGGVIASGHKDGSLRLWSPTDPNASVGGAKVHNKGVISVSCLQDGHSIVSLGRDNVMRLSDTRMNITIVRELEGALQCMSDWHRIAVDGRHVACGISRFGSLGIWNVDTGKIVRRVSSQPPDSDSDVLDMVARKLRSPGGIILPLWTASGSFVSAHRTRQVSLWNMQ